MRMEVKMGLLDQISSMLGGGQGGEQGIQGALMALIGGQEGGLAALGEKLKAGGLGDAFASWVGTGENQAVSPDALHGALGSDLVQQLAAKTGLPVDQLMTQVSQYLPGIINHVTPNGTLPDSAGGLMEMAASFLKGKVTPA